MITQLRTFKTCMLRIPTKINGVNNLSDARYCAAMGVDLIGFSITKDHERSIPLEKINGITGWLSGVQVVAEEYSLENWESITFKSEAIHAKMVEIDVDVEVGNSVHNVMYRIELGKWKELNRKLPQNALLHLLLPKKDGLDFNLIQSICSQHTTYLNVTSLTSDQIEHLISTTQPYGITLDGGNEISPGISDFDHIAEVLEYLEA